MLLVGMLRIASIGGHTIPPRLENVASLSFSMLGVPRSIARHQPFTVLLPAADQMRQPTINRKVTADLGDV